MDGYVDFSDHPPGPCMAGCAVEPPPGPREAVNVKCNGEAHQTPWPDFCGVCAPWWEWIPTCPEDGLKLTTTGYCRECRRHFEVNRQ